MVLQRPASESGSANGRGSTTRSLSLTLTSNVRTSSLGACFLSSSRE